MTYECGVCSSDTGASCFDDEAQAPARRTTAQAAMHRSARTEHLSLELADALRHHEIVAPDHRSAHDRLDADQRRPDQLQLPHDAGLRAALGGRREDQLRVALHVTTDADRHALEGVDLVDPDDEAQRV